MISAISSRLTSWDSLGSTDQGVCEMTVKMIAANGV